MSRETVAGGSFVSVMAFYGNDHDSYDVFIYGIDDAELLVYAPAPVSREIPFECLYLPGSCGGVFF